MTKPAFLLAFISTVALLLRIWGIGFGLPLNFHPDEPLVFTTAFRIVRTSDLHPHTFIWPSLFFYVNAFTYAIFFLLGKIAELFPSRAEFQAYFILDPSPFVLIPRFTSAFFGTLSIFPLYLLGRALGQKKIGLLAAALLAVSPIHVEHAHFGTVDITLTFFTLCSLYFLYLSYASGRPKDYLLFGFCSGLATATKYPAGLLLVAFGLLSPLLVRREEGTPGYHSYRLASLSPPLLSLGAFLLTFGLTNPYILFDFSAFWHDFRALSTLTSQEWLGGEQIGSRFAFYARLLLVEDFGLAAGILCLGGMLLFALQQPRVALVLLTFPVLYYGFFGASANAHARFALPLVPTVLLFTAYGAWRISEVRVVKNRQLHSVIFLLIALALVGSGAVGASKVNRTFSQPDTRVIAKEWIETHIPSRAKIVTEYYGPPLNDFRQESQRASAIRTLWRHKKWEEWAMKQTFPGNPFYYVVVIPVPSPRTAEAVAQTFYSLERYRTQGIDFIIVDSNMYGRYKAAPEKYPLQFLEFYHFKQLMGAGTRWFL